MDLTIISRSGCRSIILIITSVSEDRSSKEASIALSIAKNLLRVNFISPDSHLLIVEADIRAVEATVL